MYPRLLFSFSSPPIGNIRSGTALCLCGMLMANIVSAATIEAWVQRYNAPVTNSHDRAFKIVSDANGDVIVTGTINDQTTAQDILTIKYSGLDGSVIWSRRYNGSGNGDDVPHALAMDANGNVIVSGYSYNGADDYYTAKYAAVDGALLWEKRYNGPIDHHDRANAMAVDSTGNVVVTGSSFGVDSNEDYYTAKYAAADGALIWERRYNDPGNAWDFAVAVAVDANDNVVVTGTSGNDSYTVKYAASDGAPLWDVRSSGGAQAVSIDTGGNVVVTGYHRNGSNRDIYTAKYAAVDGTPIWEQRYNGPENNNDEARALGIDGNGDVIVTGISKGIFGNNSDYYTAKYSGMDGALLWERRYNGTGNGEDEPSALAVGADGSVVVTGFSFGRTNDVSSGKDFYTVKYTADGTVGWERRETDSGNTSDEARAVAIDAQGHVFVTGCFFGTQGRSDYYTARYSADDGLLLWETRYNGIVNGAEVALAVTIDHNGAVIVTGNAMNSSFNFDYHTIKYAADGSVLWERQYDGLKGNDSASAVAVDALGNVVVTGSSSDGTDMDFYTAKYSALNGDLLWERRYNGPLSGADDAVAVAVDAHGDVFITGSSESRVSGIVTLDYYTAKYSGIDGSLLWERRYDSPANSDDAPAALVVDANGDVVVTGRSFNGSHNDYYTAKYRGTTGTLLWERSYNGTGNGRDEAQAVAVDRDGNVVVTGFSEGNNSRLDYYTVKYAAADGLPLWEVRYDGPDNRDDRATSVAVDADGNVVVTGFSTDTTGFVGDYYTAKYAVADGSLLWEVRYNGVDNKDDRAYAVAVDASGNVVVTGTSSVASSFDFYTVMYAGMDGSLLWEHRYGGAARGEEILHALALGPNGAVAIAGSSDGDFTASGTSSDFITVLYQPSRPPEISCPTNITVEFTDENGAVVSFSAGVFDDAPDVVVVCTPASGSTFPIGTTLVTCMASNGPQNVSVCEFTITVLGSRGVLENVLTELTALRADESAKRQGLRLDRVVERFIDSLIFERWIDTMHLNPDPRGNAFLRHKRAYVSLRQWMRRAKDPAVKSLAQNLIRRTANADRLLAVVALKEAVNSEADAAKLAKAQKYLAKGDRNIARGNFLQAIENYRLAWLRAAQSRR